jgi:hypothetical protein
LTETASSRAKKDQVFLISQIDREGSDIRKRANVIHDHIVDPIAKEFGLKTLRSDRDATPGPITSQILTSILESRVVVADLTGRNANVYYELAFVHSFGIPVVILVNDADTLTFDVKNERVIEIGDDGQIDMEQGERTKNQLRSAFQIVLEPDYKPRSLVTEVAGAQDLQRLSPDNPMASELTSIRERVDEVYGILARGQRRDTQRSADANAMLHFISQLAESGRLDRDELMNALITTETSPNFDAWVERQVEKIPASSEEDFEDIPF